MWCSLHISVSTGYAKKRWRGGIKEKHNLKKRRCSSFYLLKNDPDFFISALSLLIFPFPSLSFAIPLPLPPLLLPSPSLFLSLPFTLFSLKWGHRKCLGSSQFKDSKQTPLGGKISKFNVRNSFYESFLND